MKPILFLALGILLMASCKKAEKVSEIPEIKLLSMSPGAVKGGSGEDTVYLSFTFQDGDADLGHPQTGTNYDIFIRDSRDSVEQGYFFPAFPDVTRDQATGMKGSATIYMLAAFLLPRADSLHQATGDTLHFELYIKDLAGHESNRITTPDLRLVP